MRVGIVTFPGSLDDRDAARAVRYAGGEAGQHAHRDAGEDRADQAQATYPPLPEQPGHFLMGLFRIVDSVHDPGPQSSSDEGKDNHPCDAPGASRDIGDQRR